MEANKIEKFYKETFAGYEYKLSETFWQKLKWRLLWVDLKYYFAGAGVLAIISASLYFGLPGSESESVNDPYFTSAINFQSTVIQTIATVNSPLDHTFIHDHTKNASTASDNSETVKTDNLIVIQKIDNDASVVTEDKKSELLFEIPSIIELSDTRNTSSPFLMTSATASDLHHIQPEIIYDSTLSLYIQKRKANLSISIYVSPAYNVPNIQSVGGYDDYLKYRTDHESASISMSAGIDVQLNIKNWTIQTGLAYSRLSNYRNYNHSFLDYDSTRSYYTNDTTWGWIFDPPEIGKPIVIAIDSVLVPVYNDINEGRNEWNYFEIPLLVGYKLNKNRFSFDVATGFSYGLLINASGNVPSLTQESSFTELSEMESLINRNQFNYILQVGVSYHLTPNWSIMAKPYYKQNLINVFDNNYPIDQRFRSFGVKLGLTVDL